MYKQWAQDCDWQPSGYEPPLLVFKTDAVGNMVLPQGAPCLRDATYNRQNLDMVRRTISSASHHLFDESHRQWWEDFFQSPEADMPTVGWYLEELRPQPTVTQTQLAGEAGEEHLADTLLTPFLQKERQAPKVLHARKCFSNLNLHLEIK